MRREAIRKVTKAIPDMLKEVSGHLKSNMKVAGQSAFLNASGTVGLVIRLFGNSIIESYFERVSKKKLDDFGTPTYLSAAFIQAEESLKSIKDLIETDDIAKDTFEALQKAIGKDNMEFDESEIIVVFQPKFHPAVLFVKGRFVKILEELKVPDLVIEKFVKHFNQNISAQVVKSFDEDYEKHLEDIAELRLNEQETEFLWAMKELDKIGFNDSENLKYETAYARWRPVEEFREIDDIDFGEQKTEEDEAKLEPAERLVDDYFNFQPNNNVNKILFILGDFGKGKSVFLRHYAAILAKQYLRTGEGRFPVYFNLRNFKKYSSIYKYGVIADFLETEYGIQIDSPHFINRSYTFLIDSLDESGDLNQADIDKVIASVKAIQNLDKSKYRTNRLIICTRPFDGGLYSHLKNHRPHTIKNGFGRDVEYFISLYGFTKLQFNNWMIDSLINYPDFEKLESSSLTKKIQDSIEGFRYIDIYNELLVNGTLSRSELRRPIFAYMIFKLLVKNIDFFKVGKIGVYLSFINLLTREAKHIESDRQLDLNKEFEFRNMLHSIAALSMYNWQKNKQMELRKAEICRVLDGELSNETDEQILERYKNKGVLEIEFLSHSYFGENNNILHFQHKSFAEILLAEYYLKVFIRYALDDEMDIEKARIRLSLGQPSAQTIQFLVEMLRLLRSSAAKDFSEKTLQKRKLLFPLMASLSTKKNNNLFCHDLYYEWFRQFKFQSNIPDYPAVSIENWFFSQEKIGRMVDLAASILNSPQQYMLVKTKPQTVLYNHELVEIQNDILNQNSLNSDKWIALLVGNILYNEEKDKRFFNSLHGNYTVLFEMIRNWNYFSGADSSPFWAKSLFKGIQMDANDEDFNLSNVNVSGINFSHSFFKNLNLSSSKLNGCIFNEVGFEDVDLSFCDLTNARFSNIHTVKGTLDLGFCLLSPEVFLPPKLARRFFDSGFMGNQRSYIPENGFSTLAQLFDTLYGFLDYGIKNNLFSKEEISTWFHFETLHMEGLFERKLGVFERLEQEILQ
jgi:hypothetical protein